MAQVVQAEVRRQLGALEDRAEVPPLEIARRERPAFRRGEDQIVLLIIRPQLQSLFSLPAPLLGQRERLRQARVLNGGYLPSFTTPKYQPPFSRQISARRTVTVPHGAV